MTAASDEFNPSDWMSRLERAFFTHLSQHYPEAIAGIEFTELIGELTAGAESLIHNSLDAANIHFAALAVAGVTVLERFLDTDRAMQLVSAALNEPLREDILTGTRAMLDAAEDPYAVLVESSRHREENWFGPSFIFERPLDDDKTYVLDIRRCLFHDALVTMGCPELQPTLCRFDLNWADALDPVRHGVTFIRPVTHATGTTCRMVFSRVEG